MNFSVTQLLKIKGQPIGIQLGYRYHMDGPVGGPKRGLRFAVTLLFQQKHKKLLPQKNNFIRQFCEIRPVFVLFEL